MDDTRLISNLAEVGIIFLLFLLGLHLTPQKLYQLLKQTLLVTLMTSVIFGLSGWSLALAFGFGQAESLLVGTAAMFSSTIMGIKLLPTTNLDPPFWSPQRSHAELAWTVARPPASVVQDPMLA